MPQEWPLTHEAAREDDVPVSIPVQPALMRREASLRRTSQRHRLDHSDPVVAVQTPRRKLCDYVEHLIRESTDIEDILAFRGLSRGVRLKVEQHQPNRLATRFARDELDERSILKSGIPTRNARFNELVERLDRVAVRSSEPILLLGPTGAGKSLMARRIYDLKKARRLVTGQFVEVNCATIRGDAAMSALFGHVKGAFTGAVRDRPGLLLNANGGLLFLDEVGELGSDEQAMLLRALEDNVSFPSAATTRSPVTFS